MSSTAFARDVSVPGHPPVATPPSLYERLGGARGVSAIVEDIVALHMTNSLIKARFQAIAPERLPAFKKNVCDFFGAGSGGPETYVGKDLISAHKGMNVSEQELIAAIDDIMAALDKNAVGQAEKNEVVAILYSMKDQIVRL